uniref:Uncharacterized protein n=1 Tax=candidate division WOR-3 bacterium TaxID=2052148 RepID=A0A7C4GDA1_UNCW3
MPSDVVRRIAYWDAKTEPELVMQRLVRVRQVMRERYRAQQVMLVEIEQKARGVLNAANVPAMLYIFYLNFAREVYNRRLRLAGPSLAREVNVLLEKWVGRTLEREVLERIRDEAMSVRAPEAE